MVTPNSRHKHYQIALAGKR